MDNEFENIVPWNGANDTGKDVRLKWQRNFERIKANFEELLQLIGKVDIQELSKFFLRKDKSDSTDFAVQFNDGVKIGKSWIRWDEINNALYIIGEDGQSKVNFYSFGEVAAGGPGSSSGGGTGGLDENQLWAILANTGTEQISKTHLTDALSGYATENWVLAKNYLTSAALSGYATQSWVTAQGYITSAALEGYATISDVDNRIDDLINGAPAAYDTLKEIADVLQGNVDSIGDIITTLGTKADKAISISAGIGLTGGGNLSASRILSLATVGTAGTYTKVTVDVYGRVTGHSALAESDIPTLSIAKISGLQTALDNKLDESVFTDLFEKVTEDGQTFIKAKYNFYSVGEVAAGGPGSGSSATGSGIDEEQLWSILSNSGTEQIAKNHLTSALASYVTQSWVTSQNYLKTVSLATISDLHVNWDALLKVAPSAYITRWPAFSEITSKPTTLAGYGITDGANAVSVTGSGNAITAASISGHTLTLTKGSSFLLSSAYTAADVLGKLKTVDGSGSGLDADTLDGIDANDLFTNLSNSGNNISITIGGTNKTLTPAYATNTGGALSGKIQYKSATKNDNGARDTYLLIADCSILYSQDTGSHFGFNGTILCHRNAGYPINEVVTVSAVIGYTKTNYQLYTSYYSRIQPCIVSYNSKYYVALRLKGSSFNLYMCGNWQNTLFSFIQLNVESGQTYPTGMSIAVNGVSYYLGVINATTRLFTPRTLWGKSFDGTANISGDMTGVGNIVMSGNITGFKSMKTAYGDDNRSVYMDCNGVYYCAGNSGWAMGINARNQSNSASLGAIAGVLGSGDSLTYTYYGGSYDNPAMVIMPNKNIGIGTKIPEYKLYVAGTIGAANLITAFGGLTTSQYIQIGSGRIYWDSTNNALYVKKSDGSACNFYSLGEIVAGGAGTGSGGTGESIDEEQLWSILGNTGTEQIAKNHLTSALAGYLTSVSLSTIKDLHANWDAVLKIAPTSYVKRWPSFAEVTAKPTTISGYGITDAVTIETTQTITGVKTFSRNTASVMYLKNSADTSNYVALRFMHKDSDVGGIAGDKDGSALYRVDSGFTTVYKLLDTSNYSTTLDTRYVKKAGDTMTGSLTINSTITANNAITTKNTNGDGVRLVGADGYGYLQLGNMNSTSTIQKGIICGYSVSQLASLDIRTSDLSGGVTINGNTIWHAGNDGAGSGLDADKLYGLSYNSYESYRKTTIDASDLNNNTWYPVVMVLPAAKRVRIRVEDVTNADASWNNRADKNMGLVLDYTAVGSAWGWVSENRIIYWYNEGSGASSCLRGLGQLTNNSAEYIFVRGGAKYNFYLSHFIVPKLYTTIYTGSGGQTIAPTTSMPAAITRNSALITDNVASANKLYNPRTIWGQSFDGTANVSGALTGVTNITASGSITASSLKCGNSVYGNTYIELYGPTPYIDFHFGSSTADYTSRIIEKANGVLTCEKAFTVGSALTVNGITYLSGYLRINNADDTYRLNCFSEETLGKVYMINAAGTAYGDLAVGHYSSNAIYVKGGNNVGIGTASPSYKLHVFGTFGVSDAVKLSSTLSVTSTSTFTGKTTHNGGIACANGLTLSSGELMLGSSSNQKIRKGAASATYWSQLEFFGSAGSNGGFTDIMLNIQSSHTIQFDCGGNFIWFSKGNIAAKGELAAGSSSDIRLKKILSTPDYQKRLLSLGDVVDYEYNDKAFRRNARTTEHRRYTGLIWQNVVNVLPQMAGKDDDGYGYLNYIHTDYINLIAGALQQTIRKQETIEQRVERLERENAELKQQLKRLAA